MLLSKGECLAGGGVEGLCGEPGAPHQAASPGMGSLVSGLWRARGGPAAEAVSIYRQRDERFRLQMPTTAPLPGFRCPTSPRGLRGCGALLAAWQEPPRVGASWNLYLPPGRQRAQLGRRAADTPHFRSLQSAGRLPSFDMGRLRAGGVAALVATALVCLLGPAAAQTTASQTCNMTKAGSVGRRAAASALGPAGCRNALQRANQLIP